MTFPPHDDFRRRSFLFLLVASLLVASTKPGFAQVKTSIPTAAQQKEKAKVLEEIYKLSRLETAAKKQEVIKDLVKYSRDDNLPPDERYVVLTTLITLTNETGDFTNGLDAVNGLVEAFDVDAREEKQRWLVDFLGASKSGLTLKPAAVDEALAMARAAAQEDRNADANSLLKAVESAVRRPPASNVLIKAVAETRDTINGREKKAFQAISPKDVGPYLIRTVRPPEYLVAAGGTTETEQSVEAAMNWLARHQNADGSWGCQECVRQCKDPSCTAHVGKEALDYPMAATAFGMLPFFAAGKTHESSGPYQKTIRKGLVWMTRNQDQKSGQLGSGNMYEHGLATIALCEAYGVSKDQKLKNAAMAAVKFIEFAQNETSGGWHYTARPKTVGDTSVLGWQFMGLKNAQMAGLPVSLTTLRNAKKFLASVSKGKSAGLFSYMPQSQPTPAMSAVGLLCQQYSGLKRTDPAMTEGVNYLLANVDAAQTDSYFLYYAMQVMHNLPGEEWTTWNRQVRGMLVESQIKEGCATGSWKPNGKCAGPVMSTSIHALTLEIYYRYLPLYPPRKGEAKAE